MGAIGVRSRDHLWQLWLVGLAALVVSVVGVMLVRGADRDETGTVGQLTASDQGLAASQLVAGPSDQNDRRSSGERRSAGAIGDQDDAGSARRTLVADTRTSATAPSTSTVRTTPTTEGEPATTDKTEAETTTTEKVTTTAPQATTQTTTTQTSTSQTTEPPTTTEPTVTSTVPPTTGSTVTLPTITIPLPPPPQHNITPEDLRAARDRFAATGYTSYGMTVQRSCFCLPEFLGPFEVIVRNGEIVSVTNIGGFDDHPVPTNQRILTVPRLFDYIEDGFDSDRMDVVFDKETGVPRSISIDHIFGAIDDEVTVTVTDFSPHR